MGLRNDSHFCKRVHTRWGAAVVEGQCYQPRTACCTKLDIHRIVIF